MLLLSFPFVLVTIPGLRGYHADNHQEPGYKDGIINSYYYALADRFDHMLTYYPVKQAFYAREFPTSWRLIDYDIDDPMSISKQ